MTLLAFAICNVLLILLILLVTAEALKAVARNTDNIFESAFKATGMAFGVYSIAVLLGLDVLELINWVTSWVGMSSD